MTVGPVDVTLWIVVIGLTGYLLARLAWAVFVFVIVWRMLRANLRQTKAILENEERPG